MAYGLLAMLVLGGIVFARIVWYRSRAQRRVRERQRDAVRAQNRREQYRRDRDD